jgi:hypothetical protein
MLLKKSPFLGVDYYSFMWYITETIFEFINLCRLQTAIIKDTSTKIPFLRG